MNGFNNPFPSRLKREQKGQQKHYPSGVPQRLHATVGILAAPQGILEARRSTSMNDLNNPYEQIFLTLPLTSLNTS